VLVAKELGICSDRLPGDIEGDMLGRNGKRKRGTTRGLPRRSRTAKTSHINRGAAKVRCASEWGGWGHISDDGPGHYNPDRSEGPWGRATGVAQMAVLDNCRRPLAQNGGSSLRTESTKDRRKL
jgi:hypothetical protein